MTIRDVWGFVRGARYIEEVLDDGGPCVEGAELDLHVARFTFERSGLGLLLRALAFYTLVFTHVMRWHALLGILGLSSLDTHRIVIATIGRPQWLFPLDAGSGH